MHADGGRTLREDVFLPSKHLLSAFYRKLPSKNPSKNLVFTENPSEKHLRLENLLRTLLRSVRLHDPLGVHPSTAHLRPPLSAGFDLLDPFFIVPVWLLKGRFCSLKCRFSIKDRGQKRYHKETV